MHARASEPDVSGSQAAEVAESQRAARLFLVLLRRLIPASAPLGLIAAGLLIPFPVSGRMWNELFNLAHAPTFFVVTLGAIALLDPGAAGYRRRAAVVVRVTPWRAAGLSLFILLLGAAAEALQHVLGRSASLEDLAANSCGVAAALCWLMSVALTGTLSGLLRAVCGLILLAAVWNPLAGLIDCRQQGRAFPMLSSLERSREMEIWESRHARLTRTADWSSRGQWSLHVATQPAAFSGASLAWPVPDWTGYQALQLELRNPGPDDLMITLKVFDRTHPESNYDPADRFETRVAVAAGAVRTVSVPLATLAAAPETRRMDLSQMHRVELFLSGRTRPAVFQIDAVRLIGDRL